MKEVPLSNCERDFILRAVAEKKRLDGRDAYSYRRIKISFGIEYGCCHVEIGNTRVLAQVSCEIAEPKPMRPNEGLLYVNVELSPMASPGFEAGRLSDQGVEMNRLIERCLKESRCVDLESLCIVSKEKAWAIRLDIHILNHDGNLIDAASLAGITALSHFRRPDVSVCGDEITIHSLEDRDPVPLSVHHMPICTTFAFFEKGKYMLLDPTNSEEKVMEGRMVIGMNKHREICVLQMTGEMLLLKDQVIRCSNIAASKVKASSDLIQKALQVDAEAKSKGEKYGFVTSIDTEKVTALQKTVQEISIKDDLSEVIDVDDDDEDNSSEMDANDTSSVEIIGKGSGQIGDGGHNTWEIINIDDDNTEDSDVVEIIGSNERQTDELGGDSSEEEVTILLQPEITKSKTKPARGKKKTEKRKIEKT
ncbi:exosome complex component RRP45-like [Tubulanus polymorphus]|uniref:exosome complex component RRP45-like n=1 Tax=Tubulanus polymorphus TaxID=672921 RepID=UPI003DA2C97A